MDEKMTMEITNDRLEEAIKQYAAERTKENLTTVLNLLRAEEPGTSFHAVPGVQQHRREAGTGADRAGHQSVLG